MVNSENVAKIGDFGLSRIQDHTKTMTICGSPLWTSPEMLQSKVYTEKVDVYSFAIILWELWTWDEPFPKMMVFAVVRGVVENDARPTLRKEMPQKWVDIMKRCWVRQPEKRPDMSSIAKELSLWWMQEYGNIAVQDKIENE